MKKLPFYEKEKGYYLRVKKTTLCSPRITRTKIDFDPELLVSHPELLVRKRLFFIFFKYLKKYKHVKTRIVFKTQSTSVDKSVF